MTSGCTHLECRVLAHLVDLVGLVVLEHPAKEVPTDVRHRLSHGVTGHVARLASPAVHLGHVVLSESWDVCNGGGEDCEDREQNTY